ncbi:MAG: TfoX/Sxy family protein [Steroidobacteraceae bacterium]|nr:TfoX/Sxy family protein [Steroidobacteraceae bacterium]
MATKAEFIAYVREQVCGAGEVGFRKMFGEYAVYLDGKVVALVCDDQFYLKPTAAGRQLLGEVVEVPPYPGARDHFRLDTVLEDPEQVAAVLRATAAELPLPKVKGRAKPVSRATPKSRAGPVAAKRRPPRKTR